MEMMRAVGRMATHGTTTAHRYAHHMRTILSAILIACSTVQAQQPQQGTVESLPWFVRPGEAALQLRLNVPVINQVVLVPDLSTLVDEVSKWSPKAQWPVLIDDDYHAAMFIRAFKPFRVLKRTDSVPEPSDTAQTRQQMVAAVASAWEVPMGSSIRQAVSTAGLLPPPGIVVSSASDEAVAAAVLLAAGRGQELLWLDSRGGDPNTVLGTQQTMAIARSVEQLAEATGLGWRELGDDIDAVTVCRRFPARATTQMPIANPSEQSKPVAISDVIGRLGDGTRWAFTGWMFGTSAFTAYQANCSLFLPRTNSWMCNTYPDTGNWKLWGLSQASSSLQAAGYTVTLLEHETINQLLAADRTGLRSDLVWMNTKGNSDFFRMAAGADADPGEVPILNQPVAMNLIHSWSLRSPDSLDSVGGRWLQRGVYAYVCSSQEPQLGGFVPPSLMARRIAGGVPWLIAARYWPEAQSSMARVWRINTVGDPLMIAPPPKGTARRRIPPDKRALPDGTVDVREQAVVRLKDIEAVTDDATFARAIKDVVLIGKDEIATQLWTAAMQRQVAGPKSAHAVFGALFRLARITELVQAWQRLAPATSQEGDMLWAALAPQLAGGSVTDEQVEALRQTIGPGAVVNRIKKLAPIIGQRWGTTAAVAAIDAARTHATNSRQKRELDTVSKEF